MTIQWARRLPVAGGSGTVAVVLGGLSMLAYALSLALLGTSKLYGHFLLLSIVAALPLVPFMSFRAMRMSGHLIAYIAVFVALILLYGLHVAFFGSSTTQLDNVSRIGLGLVNGGFFYVLLGRRRDHLFRFVMLLAALHAIVASASNFYAAFEAIGTAEWRFSGETNPIPFSEMLMTSIGLVAIVCIGHIEGRHASARAFALVAFVSLGMLALVLTGTRGTLLALAPLALLMMANARTRSARATFVLAVVLLVALALTFPSPLRVQFGVLLTDLGQLWSKGEAADGLSGSTGLRVMMWEMALGLAKSRPLLGYGAGSFPALLTDPALGLAKDSPIAGFNQLHNQYLDFLLETGAIGLILFVLLLGVAFSAGLRLYRQGVHRDRACTLMWVSACYACFGLSQAFLSHANTSLQFGVYMGLLMWTVPAARDEPCPTEN